ncbi:hypothetical protein CF204P1_17130 [Citrobacter freundii]|nr:hypothetical protein CF204P1_17130 [Citrobacter freundii]
MLELEVKRGNSPYHEIWRIVPTVVNIVIVNNIKSDFLFIPKKKPIAKKKIVDVPSVRHGSSTLLIFEIILLSIIMVKKQRKRIQS